jgi:septal ring factor EnvC (AmiA/AmiB activator)
MTDDGNDLRISVARIEGMLTATLARHDQRLDQHEDTLKQHETRLSEKGKMLARHDERIQDLEEDSSARWGRVTGIVALLISGAGVIYSILTP